MRSPLLAKWLAMAPASILVGVLITLPGQDAAGQTGQKQAITFPPRLPDGKEVVTDTSEEFLKPAGALKDGVIVAKTAPTIDFLFYPRQDYAGRPWSAWGDGCAVAGKYYSAIGDHKAPRGTALVCEYDSSTRKLRLLVNLSQFLAAAGALPPEMNYAPAKVHGRVDLGSDGWLYYATHRGSPGTTNDQHGYQGDWIFRTHPQTGKTEIVATHPVPKHCIPCSVLDPKRLTFYEGVDKSPPARCGPLTRNETCSWVRCKNHRGRHHVAGLTGSGPSAANPNARPERAAAMSSTVCTPTMSSPG